MATLKTLAPEAQLARWEARVMDTRPRVATGWDVVDRLLHRGGLSPSTLVILGGRTGTRKTSLMLNLIAGLLESSVPVGLVGLDESVESYTAKLASAMTGIPHERLEDEWDTKDMAGLRRGYAELAENFTLSAGYRPGLDELTDFRERAGLGGEKPRVIFIDYLSLLARDRYSGAEQQRVSRLVEELQVWKSQQECVLVALHQVGRMDDGGTGRYHGATPMTLESLKYGGEEIADLVFGVFRPAKDPLGNMTWEDAEETLPENWKTDTKRKKWERAVNRVSKYRNSTFLQLLKNRPGTRLHEKGIELVSEGESMRMLPVPPVSLSPSMQLETA